METVLYIIMSLGFLVGFAWGYAYLGKWMSRKLQSEAMAFAAISVICVILIILSYL